MSVFDWIKQKSQRELAAGNKAYNDVKNFVAPKVKQSGNFAFNSLKNNPVSYATKFPKITNFVSNMPGVQAIRQKSFKPLVNVLENNIKYYDKGNIGEPGVIKKGFMAGYKPNTGNMLNVAGLVGGLNATGFKNATNKFSALFDKKPRFEIDDSKAKAFLPKNLGDLINKRKGYTAVGDVLDHPELYKNYPELKEMPLNVSPKTASSSFDGSRISLGEYILKRPTAYNQGIKSEDAKLGTLLHEVQHAIQQKEGFARGGSPEGIRAEARRQILKEMDQAPDQYEVNKLLDEYRQLEIDPNVNEAYKRLSGEVEANSVASRLNLTPQQRIQSNPYAEEMKKLGVKSPADLITRFDGGASFKENPLYQEAKKYKSAEEFVKAQPTGYHFTSPETKITKWSTKKSQGRIWFTDNPSVGENVGASGRGKMYTVQFDKNAKWATPEQAEKSFTDQLISEGYDGVFHPDSTGEYGNYYEVFNPKVIKTKSQLTDIWNKANVGVKNQEFRPELNQPQVEKILPPQSQSNIGGKDASYLLNTSTNKGELQDGYTPAPKDIEEIVLGRKSYTPQGGKETGVYTKAARGFQEWIDNGVSKMAGSKNILVRGTARFLQGFASQLGKNKEALSNINQYKGGIDWGRELANDAAQKVYSILPDDAALKRVHSNLDPDLYGGKIEKLSQPEQEAADYLRQISDWINDTNYSNGFISKENWLKGRDGKYIARAYEDYDYPPEVADLIKQQSAKMDLGMFKKREELTDWKMDNSIKDPAYLVGKRLQQTIFNDQTSKMFSWLKGTDYVSDKARGGFTQVSDHKSFGEMAGKWVRNDVLEDIKGFFFTHKIADDAYGILRAYGRNPIRRGLKATKTVLNPVTRLGNRVGNMVFAWMSGINPITFGKNQLKAYEMLKGNDPLVTKMIKDGILGTDFSKGEIVDTSADIMRGNTKNIFKKGWDKASETYGKADDAAKISAMITFLKRGFSYQEASQKVLNAFQNYRSVGKFYDMGANAPVLGNAFVRFQADLQRILKNAVLEHPVRAIGTAMAIKIFGDVMSAVSGETEEEKNVRTNRVGSPHIPFTNIPLAIQTPWGEVNAARWMGIFTNTPVGGDSVSNTISKYLPFQNPLDKKNYGSDVMVGPVIATGMDTDFRGKSIQDPNQTKYKPSTLTPGEKAMNVAKYLGRSYNLPFFNDVIDTASAAQGKEDFYGRVKTLPQALMKLGGVKVEQYGSEEVKKQQDRDAEFAQYAKDDSEKMMNAISKDYQTGKIDYNTYQKRIQNIQKNISVPENQQNEKVMQNYDGRFSYIDDNGDRKTVKTRIEAEKAVAKMELKQDLASGKLSNLDNYPKGTLTTSMINDLYENGDIDQATQYTLSKRISREQKTDKAKFVKSMIDKGAESLRELYNDGTLTDKVVDDMFETGAITAKEAYKLQMYLYKKDVSVGKVEPKKARAMSTFNRKLQIKYGGKADSQPKQKNASYQFNWPTKFKPYYTN